MTKLFGHAAARLSSAAAGLLGWRAEEFWHATPMELAQALLPPTGDTVGADRTILEGLQRQFPDD